MSPAPSQIKQLQRELASGQVVVVVGSGVAVAACGQQLVEGHQVATWRGLLEHGVERLSGIGAADGDAELLRGWIGSGKPDLMINAAEIITDRLKARSEGIFRGWLADTVGELRSQEATLLQDLAALPGLLATLNYDHLLEQVTGHPAITWQDTNAVQESSVPPSGVNPEDQHRRSRCWRFASEIPCGAMGGPVCDPGLSTTSNLRTRPCPFLILPPLSWSSCLAVALPANSSLNWCARACRP